MLVQSGWTSTVGKNIKSTLKNKVSVIFFTPWHSAPDSVSYPYALRGITMDHQQQTDHAREAVKIFDRLALHYREKYMNVDAYSGALQWLVGRLPQGAMLYDLACGPGNVSKYVLDQRPDLILSGSDLSENMVLLAREANPEAEFSVMDARQIQLLPGMYDAIIVSFLIPYLNRMEVDALIAGISGKLKADGYVYLSYIEAPYHTSGPQKGSYGDLVHMYFYDDAELKPLYNKYGLSINYQSDLHTVMANGVEVTDRVIILQSKQNKSTIT